MTQPTFSISVSELPSCTLVGLSIRTSMQQAQHDCSRLWEQDFMPRMPEIIFKPANEFQGATFGVSVMTGEDGSFEYWAAAPLAAGASAPKGMSTMELPGGMYAHCVVPSLALMGAAYTALYGTWAAEQTDYIPNMTAPCFERYTEEYVKTGEFEVYMPLTAR